MVTVSTVSPEEEPIEAEIHLASRHLDCDWPFGVAADQTRRRFSSIVLYAIEQRLIASVDRGCNVQRDQRARHIC